MEGEIRPADMVPVIAPDKNGNKKVYPMRWSFSVSGIKQPLINARVESAKEKVTFKESWERRRCVIPGSYYFEWSRIQSGGRVITGDKYGIQPICANVTWLAGLYSIEEGYMGFKYPVFTILTRTASPSLQKIHDRMTVIISETDINRWVSPGRVPKGIRAVTDIVAGKIY